MTFSIILETENLGMAGIEDLKDTLESLKNQTHPVTNAKEFLVIAAGHVSEDTLAQLRSEYPWITVHQEKRELAYVESKKCGAELATGDIVIFADSDVTYDNTWLENILKGFEIAPGAAIVAGDTRIRGNGIYATAIQLMWMMHANAQTPYPQMIRHFDLNNFAIRREVMKIAPTFPGLPIYRAYTTEMRKQLYSMGYSAISVSGAKGYHLPPSGFINTFYRLLVYGADAVAKADFYFHYGAKVEVKYSPFRRLVRIPLFLAFKFWGIAQRMYVIGKETPSRIPMMILSLPLVAVFLAVTTAGSIIAFFNRTLIFNMVTAHEASHVV